MTAIKSKVAVKYVEQARCVCYISNTKLNAQVSHHHNMTSPIDIIIKRTFVFTNTYDQYGCDMNILRIGINTCLKLRLHTHEALRKRDISLLITFFFKFVNCSQDTKIDKKVKRKRTLLMCLSK